MDPQLYQAVVSKNDRFFDDLSSNGSYNLLQVTCGHKNSILHIAARTGQVRKAEKIISLCPSLLLKPNCRGDSPLHLAARLGHLEMAQLLINRAKLVEVETSKELLRMENQKKDTALHDAVRNGHMKVVSLLVEEDSELTRAVNSDGDSPIFVAVDRRFYDIARYILEVAPMCSFAGRSGMNVLHAAVIRAETRLVTAVMNTIATLNSFWLTILLIYASNTLPIIPILHGLYVKGSYNHNFVGRDFMQEVLRRCPSGFAQVDDFGWIPFHYAAYCGSREIVELILSFDISLAYLKDKEGMSALHIAAKFGTKQAVEKIITMCPDTLELLDNKGRTAFHLAVHTGNIIPVKAFLKSQFLGDVINEPDYDGNTPLHTAALKGHWAVLLTLANDGRVDCGAINNTGFTAFDIYKSHIKHDLVPGEAPVLVALRARGVLGSVQVNKGTDVGAQPQLPTRSIQLQQGQALESPTTKEEDSPQRLKEIGNINLVVATIVATVTFTATVTMPGGYHGNDADHHHLAGTAILTKKPSFAVFVLANSLAFGVSTASMFLHAWASLNRRRSIVANFISYGSACNIWSIFAIVLAFVAGAQAVLGESWFLALAAIVAGGGVFTSVLFIALVTTRFRLENRELMF